MRAPNLNFNRSTHKALRVSFPLLPPFAAVHCFLVILAATPVAARGDWIRPGLNTNQPIWGLRGGLLWAVAPAGFRTGEHRGLIRLGYPVLPGGRYDLINFIAVEPIVGGHRGFSELERSQLDRTAGKRIWAEGPGTAPIANLVPGQVRERSGGHEDLQVGLRVEKFDSGAHVRLVVLQRSDRPDEIQLSVFQEPDSAHLDYCILTATMGNVARTPLGHLAAYRERQITHVISERSGDSDCLQRIANHLPAEYPDRFKLEFENATFSVYRVISTPVTSGNYEIINYARMDGWCAEHPELVAERITRLARVLGRENVIAGTDCGFAQGPFYRRVHPSVMWAKLEALSEGARLASKELW